MKSPLLIIPLLTIVLFFSLHDVSATSTITITQMNDTVASSGISVYSTTPILAEYITSSSYLVGKSIDTISLDMRTQSSVSGIAQVGIFNTDQSIKVLFGIIDTSKISKSYAKYSFSLPSSQSYLIQAGDRVGIKFTGGNSGKNISVMTDQTNSFNGGNSYLTYYQKKWISNTNQDLWMIATLNVIPTITVTATPSAGTYAGPQSVTLSASSASAIYYTTDGSNPTTSSTNSPSPVSINVNTNSTLKFFAKDSQGNLSLTTTSVYTILGPLIVSSSPAGNSTYSSPQSITITASRPSTIYYTTDGSNPTKSSTNGQSPLSGIVLNTNSTIKFSAQDSLGNISHIMTETYVIKTGSVSIDPFGLTELYPTIPQGRTWYSNWFKPAHTILSGDFDPYDAQFEARGDGYVRVNGDGTVMLNGDAPRMYVLDPTLNNLWNNVEITLYAKRVSETQLISWQGIEAGARSGSHDDVTYPDVCTDSIGYPNSAYGGRLTYDGRADFEKEVLYHVADAVSDDGSGTSPVTQPAFPTFATPIDTSTGMHTMPKNTWIGYKFVAKDAGNGAVKLETWMDLTGGSNGGNWIKVNEYLDNGAWFASYYYGQYSAKNWPCPSVPKNEVINHPTPYIFVRADSVNEIDYKSFSIREINATAPVLSH